MAKEKDKEKKISVLDAVETLTAIAEVDVASKEIEGLAKEEEKEPFAAHLLEPKAAIKDPERIKESFKAIHEYLKEVVGEKRVSLKSNTTQQGIKAIIEIAEEAAEKVQKYSNVFQGIKEGMVIPEFQDLYDFYLSKIVRKVENVLAEEEKWHKNWAEEKIETDLEKKSLKDLETVRKDLRYELFYIRDEEGKSFFNKNLLRHISLVGSFDEFFTSSESDDPFLKVQFINDHHTHLRAKKIHEALQPHTDAFFKSAFKYKEEPFVAALIKAYMALCLCANPQNLLQNASSKHCALYFTDFILFLREALETTAYNQLIQVPPKDKFFLEALYLVHTYCMLLYSMGMEKEGFLELFKEMLGRQMEVSQGVATPMAIWHSLVNEDEQLRAYLKRFPSGPLMKALDLLRDQDYQQSFDPMVLGNFPSQLFSFTWKESHVSVVKLPCPITQAYINESEISLEFKGYLRNVAKKLEGQKILLINLQDRTSWQEHTRSSCVEALQQNEEFKQVFTAVTFAREGDFYHQIEEYRQEIEASAFIQQFLAQLEEGPACGFYFPKQVHKKLLAYAHKLFASLHEVFFSKKKILTRKNRLDFIEIAYQFLFLYLIEEIKPAVLLFSCKDGVDNSSTALTSFYTFLTLFSQEGALEEQKGFLQAILYREALLYRERALNIRRLSRFISSISLIHAELIRDLKSIKKELTAFFPQKFFETLKLING